MKQILFKKGIVLMLIVLFVVASMSLPVLSASMLNRKIADSSEIENQVTERSEEMIEVYITKLCEDGSIKTVTEKMSLNAYKECQEKTAKVKTRLEEFSLLKEYNIVPKDVSMEEIIKKVRKAVKLSGFEFISKIAEKMFITLNSKKQATTIKPYLGTIENQITTNNLNANSVISDLPDFIITDLWIEPCDIFRQGEWITIKAKVKNIGASTTYGFWNEIWIEGVGGCYPQIFTLASGETKVIECEFQWEGGCHVVHVWADSGYMGSGSVIDEENEDNNWEEETYCASQEWQMSELFVLSSGEVGTCLPVYIPPIMLFVTTNKCNGGWISARGETHNGLERLTMIGVLGIGVVKPTGFDWALAFSVVLKAIGCE